MINILYIYATGALLVAVRLAWHMTFRLDGYDWYYNKEQIWVSFGLTAVLWPLTLIRPRILIDPRNLFEDSFGIAARMRERDQLRENPPPCGSLIRYRQEHGPYTETYGEFLFQAPQVEQALRQHLSGAPNLFNDDDGVILNWTCGRDEALIEPPDVPSAWARIEFVANDLIRAGKADVKCLKCAIDIEQSKIVTDDDRGRAGWNYDRLLCPNGHNLLVVRRFHILR